METAEPHTRARLELSGPTGGLRRTPRVLGLLHELFDNGYLHTGHLKSLDANEKTERLLLRMAEHRLVSRTRGEWGYQPPAIGGRPPSLYTLDELGAFELADAGMISLAQWDEWKKERNARAGKPGHVRHQIANADVTVWFHHACQAHDYRMERGYRIANGHNPRMLVIPERAHALITDNTYRIDANARPTVIWIETDCATEPYARYDNRDLKSIERMFKGYLAYVRSGLIRAQFGIENFFQLTITTGGAARVEGIAKRAHAVGLAAGYSDQFLVTNFDALRRASPFAVPWMNATGEIVRLRL
jgi:hypothetical protein